MTQNGQKVQELTAREIEFFCGQKGFGFYIIDVSENCSVAKTRRAVFESFFNRAFPQNEEVISQLIAKQDQFAKLLGFPNFAAYDLSDQMAGSLERVESFLKQIGQNVSAAADLEFQKATQELPNGVSLNASGQLERCDQPYVYSYYRKKHFPTAGYRVEEYFPLDQTLRGLIRIYEQFFDLSIREVPHSVPIPDLLALEIRNRCGQVLGIVLLDLFSREGKCSHSGVHCPLIKAFSPQGGPDYPGVSLIITNFIKPVHSKDPVLMKHWDVLTFFHEFGHAIHSILGRTEFYFSCGTQVKRDFVELPSTLLERWIWDPAILKLISSHYATGEPLPDEMIQNLIRAEHFGQATRAERMCALSEISLAFFSRGEVKSPTELVREVWARQLPHFSLGEKSHFHTSWWHVSNYGPKYYAYLWSEVFAFDLFEKIRKQGLLNKEAGAAYVQAILSKGGSRDPDQMLADFLGREPSPEPFFRHLTKQQPETPF